MFKAILALALLGSVSSAALADDGGVVAISVNDLKFGTATWDQNGNDVLTPIDVTTDVRYKVEATGKEASKLMQILPSELSVMTGMYQKKYPTWVRRFNANFKTLQITGAKGQPTVSISCAGGELKFDSTGSEAVPPKFVRYKDGAHCTINVSPLWEDGDIQYNFDPRKTVCQ